MKKAFAVSAWITATVMAGIALGTAVLGVLFARRVVTPPLMPLEPLRILAVDRGHTPSVTLSLGEDADLPGRYSLMFAGEQGHVQVGEIIARDTRTVTRELLSEPLGEMRAGTPARITGWWYTHPSDLGLPWRNVSFESELGPLPAWLIEPEAAVKDKVAIHVHGRSALKQETLRGAVPAADAGFASLVMSYRNDRDVVGATPGLYGLGVTEWRDVESAIDHVVKHGATEVALVGWSMGATAVLLAALKSEHRALITHIVLESPAISWPEILAHQARRAHVPGVATAIGATLLERGSRLAGTLDPIPLADLTADRYAAELDIPVLTLVSDGDTFVLPQAAYQLAAMRPDIVTEERFEVGEHVKLWNVDPQRWEAAFRAFLSTEQPSSQQG